MSGMDSWPSVRFTQARAVTVLALCVASHESFKWFQSLFSSVYYGGVVWNISQQELSGI